MSSSIAQYLIAIFSVAGVFFVLLAHRELRNLKSNYPELLLKAGIVRIDWWWKCLRGMYRLGFHSIGGELSTYTRTMFKGVIFTYAWLLAVSAVIICRL